MYSERLNIILFREGNTLTLDCEAKTTWIGKQIYLYTYIGIFYICLCILVHILRYTQDGKLSHTRCIFHSAAQAMYRFNQDTHA